MISEMLFEFPNLYTDISFTLENQKLIPFLDEYLDDNKINKNILFGTDYYMVETETNEYKFVSYLKSIIGKDKFKLISETNTNKFLGHESI
jgi:predicted TIM-barrel fold metal-dependent hydrolase